MLKELQALALDVNVLDDGGREVKLMESTEYGNTNINALISREERNAKNREKAEALGSAENADADSDEIRALIDGSDDTRYAAFENVENFGRHGFTKQEFDAESEELVDSEDQDTDGDIQDAEEDFGDED